MAEQNDKFKKALEQSSNGEPKTLLKDCLTNNKVEKLNSPDRERLAKGAFQYAFLIGDKDIDRRWLEHEDKNRWYYLADEIIALLPKPLEMPELRDRWHIIWDMCQEFITDPADCNELSTNIDALIEPLIKDAREQERERIIALGETLCLALKNHKEWQALKE